VSDLTRGSVMMHILRMAAPVAISMMASIAYQLIDIYFLAELGSAAVAGVSAAGGAGFLVIAMSKVLGVGTMALISQAFGRRDYEDGTRILNQGIALSALCAAATLFLIVAFIYPYLRFIAADKPTVEAGVVFMIWALPAFMAMLPMIVLMSALQGCGVVWPSISISMLTITINAILAPVLIGGWGTGIPLGVQGAGVATSFSVLLGTAILGLYVQRSRAGVRMDWRLMWPRVQHCRRILAVGLPTGGEIALLFLLPVLILYVIREFGASSQAGYSIGLRITQSILLPGMSTAVAVAPLVGQNTGAAHGARVIEVFRKAMLLGGSIMLATSILVYTGSRTLVDFFNVDASASEVAVVFLRITSFAFVAQAVVATCSSVFQGLGNTRPSLISSGIYFVTLSSAVLLLSARPTFRVEHVWYLIVGALMLQAIISLLLLRAELKERLLITTCEGAPSGRARCLADQ
jgi:putative MATE family efflux protein